MAENHRRACSRCGRLEGGVQDACEAHDFGAPEAGEKANPLRGGPPITSERYDAPAPSAAPSAASAIDAVLEAARVRFEYPYPYGSKDSAAVADAVDAWRAAGSPKCSALIEDAAFSIVRDTDSIRIAALEAELAEARKALEEYGQHGDGCLYGIDFHLMRANPRACGCGLDAALRTKGESK